MNLAGVLGQFVQGPARHTQGADRLLQDHTRILHDGQLLQQPGLQVGVGQGAVRWPLMSRAKLRKPVTAQAMPSAASLISLRYFSRCPLLLQLLLTNSMSRGTARPTASCSSSSRPLASSWHRLTSRRGSGEEELRVRESQEEVEEVEELDAVLIR